MLDVNRRKFLLASIGVGAAGLLGASTSCSHSKPTPAWDGRMLDPGSGILVIVTLYGGNDGLSTVIPYADDTYYVARPHLAYAPDEVLPLDDQLGLNPGLKGFSRLWASKRLAIVRGVSYPKPDRSHFRSMDIWQTASPTEPQSTGWIGRWLDTTGDDPLRAVNVGATLPPLAVGARQTASTLSGDTSSVSDDVAETLTHMGTESNSDDPEVAAVRTAYRATRTFSAAIGTVLGRGPASVTIDPTAGGLTAGPSTTDGNPNPLANQLAIVAKCIKAGLPTRVYSTAIGGFDTHADERKPQERLLISLDEAVVPFLEEVGADKFGHNTVVMIYSEFGRRVHANASHGTDHGTAGPMFIAGAPVKGGFFGDQPSLDDLDDGDLKGNIDFRDVYHELLTKSVGADPTPSVGPDRHDIGFL